MAGKSPTGHHNQWPNVATTADLPNVSGSSTQDGAVEVGDQCYVTGVTTTYQCDTATLGAAVWSAMGGGAPALHASTHEPGGGDAMTVDAAAGTGSLRTLGTGATNACAGNDSRLSDARTPTGAAGGDLGGTYPNPTVNDGADSTAIHDNVSGEINALTEKVSPVGADVLVLEDSAATYGKKKVQITNLPGGADPNAIHDNVAGEIAAITEKVSPVSADLVLIEDSADTNNKKRVQVGNLPGGTDPNAIHDNVAGEIAAITSKATPTTSDILLIEDAADTNNKKSTTIGNLPAAAPATHATSHESGGGDVVAHQNLSGAGTNTHAQIDTHLGSTSNPHTVTAAQVGNTTAQWNADKLQGDDIDSAISPTDGQVLTYDGTGTQWEAADVPPATSYLEMGENHTLTSAGGSPDSEDVGRGIFDGSQHDTIKFRAVLNSSYATTGSSQVKLYDDGSLSTPGTPRLVTTFTHTDDTLTYETFEQALTVVSSSPTTNQILDTPRVYRAVIETTSTSGDTVRVSTVGFEAVGSGAGGAGGGGTVAGVESNLWVPPDTAHAQDDEFDDGAMTGWSVQNLTTPAAGTISLGTVNAYDTAFNSGNAVRINENGAERPSWAQIQIPTHGQVFALFKAYTLPTNLLMMARIKPNARRVSGTDEGNFGICFCALTGGVPTIASRVLLWGNAPSGSTNRIVSVLWNSSGSPTSVITGGSLASGLPWPVEYLAIHKIGTDYHMWVGNAAGQWVYHTKYSSPDFTPDAYAYCMENNLTTDPGATVLGTDFIRFKETNNFLY